MLTLQCVVMAPLDNAISLYPLECISVHCRPSSCKLLFGTVLHHSQLQALDGLSKTSAELDELEASALQRAAEVCN